MSEIISTTIIPAQPDYFSLSPYRGERGDVVCRKDAIIAWCVTIWGGGDYRETTTHPITADVIGETIGRTASILRPDGMVEETDEPIRSLSEWLSDPRLLERHP